MTERVLVCVPVDTDQARQIARGHRIDDPLQAFTAGPLLYETFGLQPSDDEEAEYATLLLAGLWGLIHHGQRLVLTAMVDPQTLRPGEETPNGGVALAGLGAASVEAWFSDDDQAPIEAVCAAVGGLELDEAWELPEVAALHADHDLAWHSVTELPEE